MDQGFVYAAPGVSTDAIPVHLQYMATPDGGAALVWQMIVQTPDGDHWYDVSIDAGTGALMGASDWGKHASYNVYARPTESPTDGPRTVVTDPWLVASAASPFGWHDTNGVAGAESTQTVGNNVDAHADHDGVNGTLDVPRPDGGAGLNFNFPINLAGSPLTYTNASVVNLFYLSNVSHDLHYLYGFTAVAGNFQSNNYGLGGLAGDAVQADAQDGSDFNNADFFTPPDGMTPRMQMYLFDITAPDRDGSLDSGIVFHEYGHGVSDRLTGGPANSNALINYQSAGMGEGWSDWWALMFMQKPGDSASAGYTIGSYALGDPLGSRRFPYSPNPAINNQTFDIYNQNGDNGALREVHNTGEIWAGVLWDLNWLMIGRDGYESNLYNSTSTAGNIELLHLVTQALKLQPANPSFTEARDAILAADTLLNTGANHDLIWQAFARRGLGYSAYTSYSDAMGVTVAFDTPFTRISGQKYNDLDGDGVKDAGEAGLSGWQIYLDVNGDNDFDPTIATQTFNYTGPSVSIPDNATGSTPGDPVTANITVSSMVGLITEVRVALADGNPATVDLQHAFDGDLEIELISPMGTIVPFVSQLDYSGYNGDNFTETFFADVFGTSINAGAAPFTGNFKPEGRLAALNGENPNGPWQLRVQDQATPDGGILNRWRLIITTGEPTTTTDGSGNYQFVVDPGTYTVREVQQSGWTQTAPTPLPAGEHTVTVAFGVPQANRDFGNYRESTISGTKYTDITGNGPGGGDTPLNGITINLYRDDGDGVRDGGDTLAHTSSPVWRRAPTMLRKCLADSGTLDAGDGAAVASQVTAGGGVYSFTGVGPGRYFVQEVVPAGYAQTTPTGPNYYTVNAISGTNVPNRNFSNFLGGVFSGAKFTDLTSNGWTGDDTPLAGVTINLFRENVAAPDGILTGADGPAIASQNSAAGTGAYSFAGLLPGTYFVQEVVPAGYLRTTPTSPDYYSFTVTTSGQTSANNRFANFQLATISGAKFTDVSGNGLTGDDTPLAGVTINLFRDDGNGVRDGGDSFVTFAVTAAGTGAYSFTGLTVGRYFVEEILPTGYAQTGPAAGYHTVNVATSGFNSTANHFANFQLATISGASFTDLTGNGPTGDDTPLGTVVINLFRDANNNNALDAADGAAIASTTTAAGTGAYTFTGLGVGRYFVQEVVPAGATLTSPATPGYHTVNVSLSGLNATARNFYNFQGSFIQGRPYNDLNQDGTDNLGADPGLGGVVISLYRESNSTLGLQATDTLVTTTTSVPGTGAYRLTAAGSGIFYVSETLPAGFVQTAPTTPDTYHTVPSGGPYTGYDFGNYPLNNNDGIGVYDHTTATWYLRNTTTAGAPDFTPFVFGTITTGLPRHGPPVGVGSSLPVVGDWDGDGDTTIGAYDPATGQWYLRNSNSAGAVDVPVFTYGSAGMIPVVGDWDGDGTDTVGVYDPRTATWYLNNSNDAGSASIAPFVFGFAGAIPVVGDWDGNGTDTVGVYDPATAAWHLRNSNDSGPASIPIFSFGFGSKLVVGDWNHDGQDTIGVWDPTTGNWYLRDANNAGVTTVPVFSYGFGSSRR